MVRPPMAIASIRWPRQMPNTGFFSISSRITGTAYSPVAAGSPGPLERKMPSGLSARISAADVCAGPTVTRQRLPASRRSRQIHRFDVVLVGADIADVRKSEGDDLPRIGRIGEDLLVAGHRRVEADLAHRMAGGTEAETFKHRAIREHEQRSRLRIVPD